MNSNFIQISKFALIAQQYIYLLESDKIENFTNLKDNNLEVGTHIKYSGAFGITDKFLKSIDNGLVEYTPFHHAVYIGDGNIYTFQAVIIL